MCQHPKHQVNVSRKRVLCALESGKRFGTPCIIILKAENDSSADDKLFQHNKGNDNRFDIVIPPNLNRVNP